MLDFYIKSIYNPYHQKSEGNNMFQTVLFRIKRNDNSFVNYEFVNKDKEIHTSEEVYKLVADYNVSNKEYYYVKLEEATPEILIKAFFKKPYQSSAEDMLDEIKDSVRELISEVSDRIGYIEDTVNNLANELKDNK